MKNIPSEITMKSTHNRRTFLSVGLVAILSLGLFTGCTSKNEASRTKLGTIPEFHPELGLGALQGRAAHRSHQVPPQRSHRGGCPHRQLPGASHLQWSSPSLPSHLVKGWHAPPNACDAGAIVLLPQGDPPHSW